MQNLYNSTGPDDRRPACGVRFETYLTQCDEDARPRMPERRDWIPAGVYLLRQQNLSLKELDERIAPEPVAGRDDCLIHPSGKVVELTEDGPEELKWRFSPKGEFYVVLQDRTVLWGLKALYEAFIAPVPFCAKITNIDPAQERLRLDNLMVIFDFEAMMEFLEVEGAFDD